MSKTIYHYQPITGEYMGQGNALRDPVEPEHYLMPADTTDQPPPAANDNDVAVFDREAGAWTVTPDWRGHEYWTEDGERHVIKALGEEPPEDALSEPPPPPPEDVAKQARAKRTALLRGCDWTQLSDTPLTTEQMMAWKDYRQALRDVPEQDGFPDTIDWPTPPEE